MTGAGSPPIRHVSAAKGSGNDPFRAVLLGPLCLRDMGAIGAMKNREVLFSQSELVWTAPLTRWVHSALR